MKATINIAELREAVSKVYPVIPSKSTLASLECIYANLTGNILELSGSDLEITISTTLTVQGQQDGKASIPARVFFEIVKQLPDGELLLTTPTEGRVRLRAGVGPHEGVYTIATDPLNVIPEIKFESKHTIVTTADRLLRIISKTLFCCSTDELRPSMMGVLFQFSTAGTTAVATDGHRLCRIALSDFTSSIDSNVIVPAKALSIIAKSFDPSEEVTINFSTESICFRSTSTYITSRLIDERYPNYEAVIPRENDKTLIVSRDRVAQSLKRTRIFANQNLQIQFILHEDSLNVQVDNAKADRYASEIIGCDYQSDDLTIGFNSRFIEEAFSHFDDDDIVIKFSTPVRAAVLEQSQREGERLLMLVMPVKLNS